MADAVGFDLQGVDELIAKMDGIQYDLRRKGGRFALRRAANVVRDAARANARELDDPETAANIAANIAVRFNPRTFRQSGDLEFRVGVLGGAKGYAAAAGEIRGRGKANPGGDTFHWRFLEFGTRHSRAWPFMRRALVEQIEAATTEFVRQYDKALERALRRQARQGAA